TALKSQPLGAMGAPDMAVGAPDMAGPMAEWGGMPGGGLTRGLSPPFNHYALSNGVVSGEFFKQLAEFKFPVDGMLARAVNAALFRCAAAEDCARGGFAGRVAEPDDLARLSKHEKHQELLAEAQLDPSTTESLRGQLTIDALGPPLQNNDKAMIKGEGAEGKGKGATGKKGALTTTPEEFIYQLDGNSGVGPTQPSEDVASSPAGAAHFAQHAGGGEASGLGQTAALNKGIVVGAHLWLRRPLQEVAELFVTGGGREFMVNPPCCDAVNDEDCIALEVKGAICAALNAPRRKCGTQRARPMKRLTGQRRQSRGSITCYVAAPASRSVAPQTKGASACPPRALEASVAVDGAPKMFAMPSPPTDEFISQCWRLCAVSDRAKCICELAAIAVTANRLMIGDEMTGPMIDVAIPRAANFKTAAENEELSSRCT
ncbi:unnamed protein product, partial [Prorocentrum cordatum]